MHVGNTYLGRLPPVAIPTQVQVPETNTEVSPVHVVKKPEVMEAVHVNMTGLKEDQWRYWTTSDLVESACMLL